MNVEPGLTPEYLIRTTTQNDTLEPDAVTLSFRESSPRLNGSMG